MFARCLPPPPRLAKLNPAKKPPEHRPLSPPGSPPPARRPDPQLAAVGLYCSPVRQGLAVVGRRVRCDRLRAASWRHAVQSCAAGTVWLSVMPSRLVRSGVWLGLGGLRAMLLLAYGAAIVGLLIAHDDRRRYPPRNGFRSGASRPPEHKSSGFTAPPEDPAQPVTKTAGRRDPNA